MDFTARVIIVVDGHLTRGVPWGSSFAQFAMKLDRAQFEALAMEHLDMLYRIARRLTRDPSAAEDLVQETYLRALRSYETFDLQEFGIRPWLLRIMHNLQASRYQREKRQPVAVEDEQLQAVARAPDSPTGPDARAGRGIWDTMDQNLVRVLTGPGKGPVNTRTFISREHFALFRGILEQVLCVPNVRHTPVT